MAAATAEVLRPQQVPGGIELEGERIPVADPGQRRRGQIAVKVPAQIGVAGTVDGDALAICIRT